MILTDKRSYRSFYDEIVFGKWGLSLVKNGDRQGISEAPGHRVFTYHRTIPQRFPTLNFTYSHQPLICVILKNMKNTPQSNQSNPIAPVIPISLPAIPPTLTTPETDPSLVIESDHHFLNFKSLNLYDRWKESPHMSIKELAALFKMTESFIKERRSIMEMNYGPIKDKEKRRAIVHPID